ncbi:MAG TPA: winged helix-turn-helix domain-containing protein [Ktedonobacteraceae bacterium]
MQESQDRLATLEQQMVVVQERLRVLEAHLAPAPSEAVFANSTPPSDLATVPSQDAELRSQESNRQGVLNYRGVAQLASRRYQFQRQRSLPTVFDAAPEPLAQLFAALGNPHRIVILRTLWDGPRSSQSLQEAVGMSSTGQLYHHLKELQAAGLIIQQGGRDYDLAPAKRILICLALAIAADLMTENQKKEPLPDHEEPDAGQQEDQESS